MTDAPDLEVRIATSGDLVRIREYLSSLRNKLARKRGGPAWFDASPVHSWNSESQAIDGTQLFVCHIESDIVGCGLISFGKDEESPDCELDLFVHGDSDRAKEIVAVLIDEFEKVAVNARAGSLDIKSLPGDQLTKSALEERGYKARLLVMNRRLQA